jgi:hypothetical protein
VKRLRGSSRADSLETLLDKPPQPLQRCGQVKFSETIPLQVERQLDVIRELGDDNAEHRDAVRAQLLHRFLDRMQWRPAMGDHENAAVEERCERARIAGMLQCRQRHEDRLKPLLKLLQQCVSPDRRGVAAGPWAIPRPDRQQVRPGLTLVNQEIGRVLMQGIEQPDPGFWSQLSCELPLSAVGVDEQRVDTRSTPRQG